ncbi:class III lanthipeptide [Alkalihalobacillus sp. NPDC078783]
MHRNRSDDDNPKEKSSLSLGCAPSSHTSWFLC